MDNKILNYEEEKEVGINFIKRRIKLEDEEFNMIEFEKLEELNALYIVLPLKGGFGIIVGNDGELLYANSSVSFERHIEEFKKGRRTPQD